MNLRSNVKMTKDPKAPAKPHSVLRSAAGMSLATLLSRIFGMVRDMVMAALFPRMVTDAYVVAFRLPNLFRRILGEGSLAASFIPLYVESLSRDEAAGKLQAAESESKAFSSAVFSMLTTLTATLSVLGVIFMPWIMSHLVGGEGYMQVPGKFELTVFLARIMFGYLFLVTTYAFYMSMANAHKIFFIPALAPAAFNLITIIFAFFPTWYQEGDQLAWGVMAGGVVQLLMAISPLKSLRVIPRLTTHWLVKNVPRFFTIVLPSMLGMSVAQLLGILNVSFASRLGQGTHSYIYFADRLLEFPQSLLSVSLGVALLPTLSELWVKGKKEEFLASTQRYARLLMVLSLPSAVGLYVLAEPIVRVIFGRGEFVAADISATAQVVMIYSFVLVVSGLHRVTVPAFYAVKNTWLPAANSAFCLVVHYFVASWATDTYGLLGLVGATAFTGSLNLGILLISYRLILGPVGVVSFMQSAIWLTPSLVVMGIVAYSVNYYFLKFLSDISSISAVSSILALSAALVAAIVAFFGVNIMLKHPESREISQLLLRRLKRS
ncbi:MAG: murein biosynthesis integral membrane protein MurJ [Bdellovibrionales bacterium]|nr:murein biosynthesis integral membrane protein MurJ [Bdellovibrionales bacterium]